MEANHANLCRDVMYKIQKSEAFENIRIEWSKLQNRCVSTNINLGFRPMNLRTTFSRHSNPCNDECEKSVEESRLVFTNNKLSVEISQDSDKNTITKLIRSGIFNFGIDLFYGSVQENLEVLVRLQEAALIESQSLGFSIPMSIYLKLSPRLQYTGGLKKNKKSFNLRLNNRVILSANRKYASQSCHSVIYINAKFLVYYMEKCDIICLGPDIQLQVIETFHDYVICTVIIPGVVTPRMLVRFPEKFKWAQSRVSAEELEDLSFAMGTNINVVIAFAPGSPNQFKQLRDTLSEFKCSTYYLFTRLTLANLKTIENANWIVNGYDGFLVDCTDEQPAVKNVKLSLIPRKFILKAYHKKKPIFLCGCWSTYVHSCDYQYAFYYPDKYVLPYSSEFLHLFEAVFNKLGPAKCSEKIFHDKSLTGSNTIARSIAAASFEFRAEAIVMCTVIGQMPIKVAHFRPKAPIIAVTSINSVINYTTMHHNIWILNMDTENEMEVSHKKDTHRKLVHGVRFAIFKKVVESNSNIILVFRNHLRYGFTDKFVVIKFDEDYAATIRCAILKK